MYFALWLTPQGLHPPPPRCYTSLVLPSAKDDLCQFLFKSGHEISSKGKLCVLRYEESPPPPMPLSLQKGAILQVNSLPLEIHAKIRQNRGLSF